MKQTFTILALLAAGALHAHTQPRTAAFTRLPQLASIPGQPETPLPFGPGYQLWRQCGGNAQAKTAASAYRLTGWSRLSIKDNLYTDSSSFSYSGNRGSLFSNEQENLNAGMYASYSRPDRFRSVKAPGQGEPLDVENQYDGANNLTQRITRSNWWTSKSVMSYDPAGRIITMLESDSVLTGWVPARVSHYRYNAAGLRVQDSVYDLSANEPERVLRYHYTAAGAQDTLRSLQWDGGGFTLDYMLVNTFDAAGNTSSSTNYYLDESQVLVPGERFTYKYSGARQLSESIMAMYDNGNWIPRARDTFGYSGAQPLYTYLRNEGWDETAGSWYPFRDWSFTQNAQGRWDKAIHSERGSNGTLVPYQKTLIGYDASGLVIGTRTYTYDAVSGSFDPNPAEDERFYYERYEATAVGAAPAMLTVSLYPNPASNALHLHSRSGEIEAVTILSAGGQAQPIPVDAAREQQIDVSAWPSGAYFLLVRVKGGNAPEILRFVKR